MPGRSSFLPLMQRFPPQHMESREQRLRIFRQGRQTPRASLQKSSPSQSSSTAQTPASCVVEKRETWLDLKDKGAEGKQIAQIGRNFSTLLVAHSIKLCARGELTTCKVSADLCPVPPEGEVRGLGLTVSAPLLPKTPGKFLIELEFTGTVPASTTSHRYPKSVRYASSARCIDGVCMLFSSLTAKKKNKSNLLVGRRKEVEWQKSKAGLESWSNSAETVCVLRHDAAERPACRFSGWSLYTCGPVCLPAPRWAQQRRRGGISKSAPLYGNGRLFSARRTAFHNVCVMIMNPQSRSVHHPVTHVGNYSRRAGTLVNPVIIKSNILFYYYFR